MMWGLIVKSSYVTYVKKFFLVFLGKMLPFTNFLPYFTGLNRLVIEYLRFTGLSTDIYNLYVLKNAVKTSVNVDNIGPCLMVLSLGVGVKFSRL